jgi:hypothetical protein
MCLYFDRLCGLVVRVPGYRFRGSGSIPGNQIFREVVGLEQGQLSLASAMEELLERKRSGSGLENLEYGRREPLYWPRNTLYQQTLTLTSLTSGIGSVGIVRSRIKATKFVFICFVCYFYIIWIQ